MQMTALARQTAYVIFKGSTVIKSATCFPVYKTNNELEALH